MLSFIMVWNIPFNGGTVKNVYEAYLVSTSNYQKSLTRTYDYMKRYAIRYDKIAQIISWGFENNTGWIAAKESANYNNFYSSKGLTVTVKLKSGKTVTCYLLNNFDGALTLTWKSATGIAVAALAASEQTDAINIKLTSAALQQNQPSPANTNTIISYILPEKYINVKIRITDYTGNIIKEIK